jgi:hypothetical protein
MSNEWRILLIAHCFQLSTLSCDKLSNAQGAVLVVRPAEKEVHLVER